MKNTKTGHKITPAIQSRIAQAAKELPPMAKYRGNTPIYKQVTVRGTEIKPGDLKPGTPYNPDMLYRINQLVYEDHGQNMTRGVKEEGEGFIDAYVTLVNKQLERFVRNSRRQRNIFRRVGRFFKRLITKKHEK